MPQQQRNKKNPWRGALFTTGIVGGGIALFFLGRQQCSAARMVRSESPTTKVKSNPAPLAAKSDTSQENWRGAPIGDGENTVDSYHSYDHRPSGSDPRDELLLHYTIHRCPNNGIGTMVSGQDPRYYEVHDEKKKDFKERNPKFVCDVAKLPSDVHQPCVVYSFGSWDEISFEVGMNKETDSKCEIHVFDPEKLPTAEVALRNHFSAHNWGIGSVDSGKIKRLSTIMTELGHSHIHVLKIDVEGHERESLPALVQDGTLGHVDQLSIEFHSVALMHEGLDLLEKAGFGIVYARREDRCGWCIEVSLVRLK